jgi:AcrR family transcriptional regulator
MNPSKRRPGPEPRFTREQLARRALTILDAHGSEGLTMRALAGELGMGTMALYRYFPSKEALIDAAIDLAAPEIELPDATKASWKQQLGALARGIFEVALAHPSLARERFSRPLQSTGALRVSNGAIALLLEAGLSNVQAVAAFKAILIHTLGAAWVATSESRPEVSRPVSDRHASLSAEELPALAAVGSELTAALGGAQAFEFGLEALLLLIETLGERRPPSKIGAADASTA